MSEEVPKVDPAFPLEFRMTDYTGMTRREYFAIRFAQSAFEKTSFETLDARSKVLGTSIGAVVAGIAVELADDLIAKLDKDREGD